MGDPQPATHAEALERPSQVAERLGISTAMLRRHVASYEAVFGSLPKSKRDGRLYSVEVAERLAAALALYHTGRVPSVEEALKRLAEGDETPSDALARAREPDPTTLLLVELKRLRGAVERQNELLAAQGERLAALEEENRGAREQMKALESPKEVAVEEGPHPWWRFWRRS